MILRCLNRMLYDSRLCGISISVMIILGLKIEDKCCAKLVSKIKKAAHFFPKLVTLGWSMWPNKEPDQGVIHEVKWFFWPKINAFQSHFNLM